MGPEYSCEIIAEYTYIFHCTGIFLLLLAITRTATTARDASKCSEYEIFSL